MESQSLLKDGYWSQPSSYLNKNRLISQMLNSAFSQNCEPLYKFSHQILQNNRKVSNEK